MDVASLSFPTLLVFTSKSCRPVSVILGFKNVPRNDLQVLKIWEQWDKSFWRYLRKTRGGRILPPPLHCATLTRVTAYSRPSFSSYFSLRFSLDKGEIDCSVFSDRIQCSRLIEGLIFCELFLLQSIQNIGGVLQTADYRQLRIYGIRM